MTQVRPTDAKWFSWEEGEKKLDDFGFGFEQVEMKDLNLVVTPNDEGTTEVFFKVGKDEPAKASSRAVRELGSLLGVNLKLLGSVADDVELLELVFDHFKTRKSLDGITLLQDREGVRGLTEDSSKCVAPQTVFKTTRDVLGDEGLGVANMLYSKPRGELEFLALTTETREPPKRLGEISHAGVSFRVNGDVIVEPAVFTLVCVNGLISEVGLRQDQVFCEEEIRQGVARARNLLAEFMAMDERIVENPSAVMSHIANEMRLPDRATRRILDAVNTNLQGENVSAYEVLNLVTALAHGQESSRFSRLGGLMMAPLEATRCEGCGAKTL